MSQLDEYLTHVADFMDRPSYERLTLETGDYWMTAVVDNYGPLGECYRNAYEAATTNSGWQYVEGFSLSIIPIMHAWCVNEEGDAVEVTWDTPGKEYRGIVIDIAKVSAAIVETGVWGVMPNDYLNGMKLLKGETDAGLVSKNSVPDRGLSDPAPVDAESRRS